MLSFFFLGSLEARTADHTVTVKGIMQQTLLATFVHKGGRVVTTNALVEELWGVTPPATVANALQVNIGRLRRTLARLEPTRPQSRLATVPAGYRLSLDGTELDAERLVETVDAIRARSGADHHRDIADLREVLTLWRGPVFGGLVGGPICREAVARYTSYRNAALVALHEAELAVGEHAKIVPELCELVAENPVHERLGELLMIALCRSGRRTDALAVGRRLRADLREALGTGPSPAIQELERVIIGKGAGIRPAPSGRQAYAGAFGIR